ncbi:hypothetical protein M8494_04920 [Serratia ureilytica]
MFHTNSNSIGGWEALIRWQHPIEGRIRPTSLSPTPKATG